MSHFILSLLVSLAVSSMGDDRTASTTENFEEAILVADDACSDRASAECSLEFLQLRGAQRTEEIKDRQRGDGAADFCCYAGSGADKCGSCYPGSRADAGSFCDSEDKCGVCGGTWCTMKCVYSSVNPHDVCGTAYKSAVAADGEFCAESEERCIGCGGSWCGMEADGAQENDYVKLDLSDNNAVEPEKKFAKGAKELDDDYDYYEAEPEAEPEDESADKAENYDYAEPEAEPEDESADEAENSYDYAEQIEGGAEEPVADSKSAKAKSGVRTGGVTNGSEEAGEEIAEFSGDYSVDNPKESQDQSTEVAEESLENS